MVLVTVIIPVFNGEDTIQSCIMSVNNQKNADFELIVIDDGSTDSTRLRIEALNLSCKFTYIYQENMGVSHARNKGIANAAGKYVLFLDADDLLTDDAVNKLSEFADRNLLDIVSCNHIELNSTRFGGNDSKNKSFVAASIDEIAMHFLDIFPQSAAAKLFRRDFLNSNKILFPLNMTLGEDLTFTYSCFLYFPRIGGIREECYQIRNVNDDSLSKRFVPEILPSLQSQLILWQSLTKAYPKLDNNFKLQKLSFPIYLGTQYFANLFKKGAPFKLSKKVKMISEFLTDEPQFVENLDYSSARNLSDRAMVVAVRSHNPVFIAIFFSFKETVKKMMNRIRRRDKNG